MLQILKDQTSYTVANVYAPTQSQSDAQLTFVDSLEEEICKLEPSNIILGGDFNLCRDPDMDKNLTDARRSRGGNTRYGDRIEALCESLMISDVWRHIHANTRRFTFRRGRYASRLDYWFASDHLLDSNTESSITPCPQSDHSAIGIQVGAKPAPRGPGLWKLDNNLLSKEDRDSYCRRGRRYTFIQS